MASRRPRSTALHLLTKLVATKWFTTEAIAEHLVVSEAELADYLTERTAIPIDRQLCLAAFVIEQVPPLAGLGHRLKGQIRASLAYNAGETETHRGPPPGFPAFR